MGKDNRSLRTASPRKVIKLNLDADFFFERAVQSLDRYHYDKALKYFRKAVEIEPDNPDNYFNMAGILSEMGNYEESNLILKQILEQFDPDMTECYFYMANNYANMEQFELAEKALVRYLEEDPTGQYLEESEEMMEFLGYELKRPTMIRKIKCREDWFEHDRARAMLEEGRFAEATKLLERLVRRKPDFTAARNNLALAYYYTGQLDKCLSTIGEVLRGDPGNLHALCNLAIVYQYTGDAKGLREVTGLLAKMYPYQPEHLFKMATTMGILGEHEMAYRHFRRLLRLTGAGGDPWLLHYMASAAYNTGRVEIARIYWDKCLAADPESPVPRFHLHLAETALSGGERVPEVSYHYQLPFEEYIRSLENPAFTPERSAGDDPLFRSSVRWALEHGDRDMKLQVIKALAMFGGDGEESALRAFLLREREEDYLKKVAIFVLRSRGVKEPLEALIDGRRMELAASPEAEKLPVWLDAWQQVMEVAWARMDEGCDIIQKHDLQTLWVEYLSRSYPDIPRMVKPEAWAAALEYLTALMHRRPVSYRDLSERYRVSAGSIRKNVERIDEMCGVKEKMRAIFPQFRLEQ
jgi:tetratricopeptide (TPR) repeat protein